MLLRLPGYPLNAGSVWFARENLRRATSPLLDKERRAMVAKHLLDAFDNFSKATGLPGGPSLVMQRHDPTWQAWKQLCDSFAIARHVPTGLGRPIKGD